MHARVDVLEAARSFAASHLAALAEADVAPARRRALVDAFETGLTRALDEAVAAVEGPAPEATLDGDVFAAELESLRNGDESTHRRWTRALLAKRLAEAEGACFALRQALASSDAVAAARASARLEGATANALAALAAWAGEPASGDALALARRALDVAWESPAALLDRALSPHADSSGVDRIRRALTEAWAPEAAAVAWPRVLHFAERLADVNAPSTPRR